MKKHIFIYTTAAALLMSACSKDTTETGGLAPEEGKGMIVLSGDFAQMDAPKDSRVAITGDNAVWSADDKIGVFTTASGKPTSFALSSGASTTMGRFAGKIEAVDGDKLYALYPYIAPREEEVVDPAAVRIPFNGQTQDGFSNKAEAHLGAYAYMASAPVLLADGAGVLNFSNLAVKMSFEFSLPEAATVRFLTMSTATAKLYDKGVVDLTADAPSAKPWGTASRTLSMGFKNGVVSANQKVVAHMMMMPVDLSSTAVTFYISAEKSDGTPVTYTMKKNAGLKFEPSMSYVADVSGLSAYNTHIPMVYVPGGSLNICGLEIEGKSVEEIIAADYKVNSFWIASAEVTNQQYCDFLNERKPGDTQLGAWIAYVFDWTTYTYKPAEQMQIELDGSTWKPKSGPILKADKTTEIGSYADYPMIFVTYLGANAYSMWLAEKKCGYTTPTMNNLGYYLPSEAQWEYAATGSEWNPRWDVDYWSGSDDPALVMWSNLNCDTEGSSCLGSYIGNGDDPNTVSPSGSKTGGTHPVGKLKPNFLGTCDMSGNVSEICRDWFHLAAFPYGGATLDPWCSTESAADKFQGEMCRACRGGLWGSYARIGYTFNRDYITPTYYSYALGFRPMLPLK